MVCAGTAIYNKTDERETNICLCSDSYPLSDDVSFMSDSMCSIYIKVLTEMCSTAG